MLKLYFYNSLGLNSILLNINGILKKEEIDT